MSTLLEWQIDAHQREVDAGADRDAAKEAAYVQGVTAFWHSLQTDSLAFGDGSEGGWMELNFTAEQHLTLFRSVAKMRRNDELKAWHAQHIVNIVTAIVELAVQEYGEEMGSSAYRAAL